MTKHLGLFALLTSLLLAGVARAEEVLFIGNSLTRSVPPVIDKIAKAQKKTFSFEIIARSPPTSPPSCRKRRSRPSPPPVPRSRSAVFGRSSQLLRAQFTVEILLTSVLQ